MESEDQAQRESSEEWQSGEEPEDDGGKETGSQDEAGESRVMEATKTRQFAVVTGASSGIGYELAKVFAENGFDLLINSEDHRLDEAKRTLAGNGTTVEAIRADLSKSKGVEKLYEGIQRTGRPVDALALNAGIGEGGDFVRHTDLEQELQLIDLNVRSTVHLSKLVLAGHGAPRRGASAVHLLDRLDDARDLPGRLQRVEVVRSVLRARDPTRVEGERRLRHLADARTDRYGLLPSCAHGGHPGRLLRAEGRSGRGGPPGIRGPDAGQGAGRLGIAGQQAAHLRRPPGPGQGEGGGSPTDGRAGLGGQAGATKRRFVPDEGPDIPR